MILKVLLLIVISFQLCEGRNKNSRNREHAKNCRKPRRVVPESHKEGITIKWEFDDDSSKGKLRIKLTNLNTSQTYTKKVDYARVGTQKFSSRRIKPGRYRAKVKFLRCPQKYAISREFQWPFSPKNKSDTKCICVPETVQVSDTSGRGVIVKWSRYNGSPIITVGIRKKGSNLFEVNEKITIEKMKNETSFPQFNPKKCGRYIALVVSPSCKCGPPMRRKSDPFLFPKCSDSENITTTVKQGMAKQRGKPALSNTNITICIVSLVTSIGILAVGILVYSLFKKTKEPLDAEHDCLIRPEVTFDRTPRKLKKKICTVRSVVVLYPPQQDDLFNAAMRLASRVQDQGRSVTSKEITADLDIGDADVIFYVTAESETEIPDVLEPFINKVVVVAVSCNGQITPSVYFPGNFIYNDDIENLPSLEEFLQLLGDQDDRVKLFILCKGDNERRGSMSKNLLEMFLEANFDVIFPDDRKHREKQRENFDQWVAETLEESHYVVIVTEDEDSSDPCPSNLTRCQWTALGLLQTLDQHELRTKVILVTFGDSPDRKFITMSPFLSGCHHFALKDDADYPHLLKHMESDQ